MQCLILTLAFAHFPLLEVRLHIQGLVYLVISASEAASFVDRGHAHRYPKVENKIEAETAILFDDAIAIFPS
jgi:hypothetical protein